MCELRPQRRIHRGTRSRSGAVPHIRKTTRGNVRCGALLEGVIDELERQLKEPGNPHPINAKILTYEDAAAWDAYRAIGAPEECRAAMEKQTACDPDKVVEQLEKLKSLVPVNRVLDDIVNDKPKELGMLIAYEKAIEIVKGGGVDGN